MRRTFPGEGRRHVSPRNTNSLSIVTRAVGGSGVAAGISASRARLGVGDEQDDRRDAAPGGLLHEPDLARSDILKNSSTRVEDEIDHIGDPVH